MTLVELLKLADANKIALMGYTMTPATLERFTEDRLLTFIHSTNAIEGNTLTLQETKLVLEGYSIAHKKLREIWEAINMEKAVSYMENAVKNSAELTEDFIQELNAYVLKNINDDMAGVYRNVNVRITGASFSPPAPQEVRILMGNLIAQYYSDLYISLHPVERAAKLHTDFVRIHPFEDGNGRTARLLMNYELRKNGFPMISIKDRVEYINALETYNVQGALEDLSTMIAQEVVNEQELIKNHSIEK